MAPSQSDLTNCLKFVQGELAKKADPEKAAGMARYMKTDMPFYGVQKRGRTEILQRLVKTFPPADRKQYEDLVLGLWDLPHREEKYLAIAFARQFADFVTTESLPLYRRLLVEGAWWDFVDEVAVKVIGRLVLDDPARTWPVVDPWIDDEVMWLRRAAIICQIGAKENTDLERLLRFCSERAAEKEFFIRKAIGWALREHAKTDPEAVAAFATGHRDRLSTLSYREATKHIGDLVN
jgi:3-methyladenine DNA glycosylase AlkD